MRVQTRKLCPGSAPTACRTATAEVVVERARLDGPPSEGASRFGRVRTSPAIPAISRLLKPGIRRCLGGVSSGRGSGVSSHNTGQQEEFF